AALAAKPESALPLAVSVSERRVRALARALGRAFDRKPVDAKIALRGTKPTVTRPKKGFRVERAALTASLRHALRTHEREPLAIPHAVVDPAITRRDIGPVVVILRDSKQLRLYNGARLRGRFGIATGQASFPTPTGTFEVVTMQRSPWWYPPPSDWAEGLEPVPPGPGNPLGTRWMGLSAAFVGIHGTPDAASIGYSASHGCIRMHISDAEWLFERVRVGTPVYILSA
ncbi:MAG TPA: L,D-transpeptidase family protein, partial [Gaiellaceae bacterium]|nr:L,D-transpeptidase family protein [Gaiellaceae bacterium]